MTSPAVLLAALKDLAHAWDGTWSQGSRSEVIDTVQRIARSALADFEAGQKEEHARWRHMKRGTTYKVIGIGQAQVSLPPSITDYTEVVIYQSEHDGSLWVRRKTEFEDGRFERILPEGPPSSADRCPDCGLNWTLFPPARIDEQKSDGRFGPGNEVRCVECKREYLRPPAEDDALITVDTGAFKIAFAEYKKRHADDPHPEDYPLVYALIAYLRASHQPAPSDAAVTEDDALIKRLREGIAIDGIQDAEAAMDKAADRLDALSQCQDRAEGMTDAS